MNFSPKIINSNIVSTKIKFNRIYCKNFIFILLMFDFFNLKNNLKYKPINFKFNIIKKRKHVGSILRAPYKSKIAQFSIGLYRYYLNLSYKIKCSDTIKLNSINDFIKFNFKIINSYSYFESALITQLSRTIFIPAEITII